MALEILDMLFSLTFVTSFKKIVPIHPVNLILSDSSSKREEFMALYLYMTKYSEAARLFAIHLVLYYQCFWRQTYKMNWKVC